MGVMAQVTKFGHKCLKKNHLIPLKNGKCILDGENP
jgi:hypothetical protein